MFGGAHCLGLVGMNLCPVIFETRGCEGACSTLGAGLIEGFDRWIAGV